MLSIHRHIFICVSLTATNPCEDEDMDPEDLKCLACTDASSDEECRENGEYEDCDATVSQIKM